MRKVFRGHPGTVIGVVALVAALSGSAIALPGTNTVDSGDIKNNAVKSIDIKNNGVKAKDLRIAYIFIDNPSGVTKNGAVKRIHKFGDQVYCLDLKFKPKTGSATRGINAGGDFTAPEIGIGEELLQGLGCPAGFRDAVVQVPGQPDSDGTYANFIG